MSEQVILCIDDESIVLESLREQIQQEFKGDFLVEIAESGDEALRVFDELVEDGYEVPIVIADFIMPGMKGDALLEKLHSIKPSAKKILLTGQASIEGVGNAVNKANLYRFISKPWEKEDLMLTLKEALKSYQQEKTILIQNEELRELNTGLEKKIEQRTIELKELNATKDKFFSIIAHDLKNPFNTLMGFSGLILEGIDELPITKIEEYIKIILETSKHSYALLENLLDWSRSQTGRISVVPEKIDLFELVEGNFELLLNTAEKKRILLTNEIGKNSLVIADTNMINTVIRNLISNALKYTNTLGKVTCCAKTIEGKIEVSINDTGIGIKPEYISNLFRIDMNYSTPGTSDESGTGLGLILCREFVAKNGGQIWVESVYGQGSSFKFTLPLAAE